MTDHKPLAQRLVRTAAERRAILEEYDSYPRGDGRRGALLRRHGVYTSQISKTIWNTDHPSHYQPASN